MLKLDTNIDLGAFWSWWVKELLAALPANVATSLYYSKGWLIVEPDAEQLKLIFQNRSESTVLGEFDTSPEAKARLRTLLEEQALVANAEVLIRIPEALGMNKILTLPEAASANIQQVLTYELDRYTPFKADQVYYDILRLGKPLNGQVKLALVLVQKSVLDTLTDQVEDLGLQAGYADYALQPITHLQGKERYNLLPLGLRHVRSKKPRVIMFASLALAASLLLTVLGMPLWAAYQGIDKLKSHVRIVEKQAFQIEETKRGIDYLYKSTDKLITKKSHAPMLIDIINTISKLLKDDTWVSQIKYSNGNLELLGESANASDLLATLEKTKYFKNARFISPVTQDQSSGKERFQLSTEIIPPAAENAPETK
ncbi:MAG: PilN domain-containing protein [Methylococcales bacterium]